MVLAAAAFGGFFNRSTVGIESTKAIAQKRKI